MLTILLAATVIAAAQDTTRYTVLNHGRPAGQMMVVRGADSVLVRYQHTDRNRGTRVQTRYRLDRSGVPLWYEARVLNPDGSVGDVAEQFEATGDSARITVGQLTSRVALQRGAYYRVRAVSTPFDWAALARYALAQPNRTAALVPTGTVRAEVVADTTLRTRSGRQRARLVALHLGPSTPTLVWLDERGDVLASDAAWFISVRPELQELLPALRNLERGYRERLAQDLSARVRVIAGPEVVIRNADLFDSERGVIVPRRTIVIRGDRIAAVGSADSVPVSASARVLDATGKTVLPGMWDMHGHTVSTSHTAGAFSQLAAGITTLRDLAGDIDLSLSQRDRADQLRIVSPRIVLAGFMEGPGAWAGPTEVVVGNEQEARAWVARYDSLGYEQIKLYNLIHPDLVPAIAHEVKKRGLRLSGHVPRGLSVPAAVKLGFDEINHAAFLFSTFFQDSLYLPQMRAYSAVAAAVARNFDVDAAPMTALIELLKAHGTVIDGTFNLWVGPTALSPTPDAQARSYLRLIKRLYDAGVTMVAGTDDISGESYHRELLIYEKAGMPAPAVLQMATIVSARVMKQDRDYGSITPGKVADLFIVAGRPAERLADLNSIEHVMRAGRLYARPDLMGALTASR